MGGGFGSKNEVGKYTIIAALASKQIGRPVKILLNRYEENIAAGNRPETIQTLKFGAKKAGIMASLAIACAVSLSPFPLMFGLFSGSGTMYYVLIIAAADAIFIYSILILLRKKFDASIKIKGAMLVALLAFLAGGIF